MHNKTPIADTLNQLLAQAKISHNELARRTGIPQPTISRIISGKSPHPNHLTCNKLAAYFGISEAQIRGLEPINGVSRFDLDLAWQIGRLPPDKKRSLALLFGLEMPALDLQRLESVASPAATSIQEAYRSSQRLDLKQYIAVERAILQSATECGVQDDLLLKLLPVIGQHLECSMGCLWQMDAHTRRIRCCDTWHTVTPNAEAFVASRRQMTFQVGEGLPGRVWATRNVLCISDVREAEDYVRAAETPQDGRGGLIAFPIWVGNEILAVMEFLYPGPVLQDVAVEAYTNLGAYIGKLIQHQRIEKALGDAEWRFRNTFDHAPDGRAIATLEGRYLQVNRALCALTGYSEQELLSKTFQDISHPDDLDQDLAYVRQLLEGNIASYQMEKRFFHRSGRILHALLSVSLVRDEQGAPLYFVSQTQDITERKRAELLLEESRQRYKSLFDHNPKAVYAMDLTGRFASGNASCSGMTGYRVEELLNTCFAPLVLPEDLPQVMQHFKKAAQGEPQSYECRVRHKEGHVVHLSVSNLPIVVNGQVVGVHGIAQDITEHKQMEVALREHQDRLELAITAANMGVWEWNIETGAVWDCPVARQMIGRQRELPVHGQADFLTHVHPEDQEQVKQNAQQCLVDGEMRRIEYRVVWPNGEIRWLVDRCRTITDTSGRYTRLIGVMMDITEHKRIEDALKESEQRYRLAVEHAPIGNSLIGMDGRWLDVNPALCRLVGYSKEELVAMQTQDITHPDDREESRRFLEKLRAGELDTYQLDKRYLHKSGREVPVQINGALVRDSEEKPLYFITQVQERQA